MGVFISPLSAVRGIVVTIALLVVAIIVSGLMASGLAFLGLVSWAILFAGIAVGLFLIVRAGRPIAGVGAIVITASTWIAFYVIPPAWVWTGLFFLGASLIAYGTRADTPVGKSWPLLLPRVVVGWALVDNSQDHLINNWLPSVQGTGFFQVANGAATRPPRDFSDQAYQAFLQNVVMANPDQWAGLVICGELAFGLLLAAGFLAPIGALGAMWLNGNYMLMKGFTSHAGYTDKTFFAVEVFCLIVLAGLAYGLDATLRRHVPASIAQVLMGLPGKEPEPAPIGRSEPQPA
jgi:hypothetical protein